RQREHVVDHLRHALRLERDVVLGTVRRAGAREEQAQVVVDLGNGADGRTRVVARRLLLDGDRRREALDQIDVGLFHELEELARVGRERLDVAPLSLGVERVEGERGLAGARQAGDHHQFLARQLKIDVLEVVRARAADAYVFQVRFLDRETRYYNLLPEAYSTSSWLGQRRGRAGPQSAGVNPMGGQALYIHTVLNKRRGQPWHP